jgi:hypothetical protein
MCHGLKNEDDSDLINFNKDPWNLLKVTTYHLSLVELRNEVKRRSRIIIATKQGGKLLKKDNPSPNQWTVGKCHKWLESFPIADPSDVIFLHTEMQARVNVATKAVEQKRREEQKLLSNDDDNNWYGNDPILRLIHTSDETEIRHAYITRHSLSNKCIVLDNAKSIEKREETVWQKMVNMWNDEKNFPNDNGFIAKTIHTIC